MKLKKEVMRDLNIYFLTALKRKRLQVAVKRTIILFDIFNYAGLSELELTYWLFNLFPNQSNHYFRIFLKNKIQCLSQREITIMIKGRITLYSDNLKALIIKDINELLEDNL